MATTAQILEFVDFIDEKMQLLQTHRAWPMLLDILNTGEAYREIEGELDRALADLNEQIESLEDDKDVIRGLEENARRAKTARAAHQQEVEGALNGQHLTESHFDESVDRQYDSVAGLLKERQIESPHALVEAVRTRLGEIQAEAADSAELLGVYRHVKRRIEKRDKLLRQYQAQLEDAEEHVRYYEAEERQLRSLIEEYYAQAQENVHLRDQLHRQRHKLTRESKARGEELQATLRDAILHLQERMGARNIRDLRSKLWRLFPSI